MLSIFSTFKETFFLAMRNFWFLAAITLMTKIPDIWLNVFGRIPKNSNPLLGVFGLSELALMLILGAANRAAIFALLRQPPNEKTFWTPILSSVRKNTWTLCRVSLLLICVGMLAAIPFVVITKLFGPTKVLTILFAAVYLVFAKYALADPLVVIENMGARTAFERSWKMTKGHFGYVGGCYLFLGCVMWAGRWLLEAPLRNSDPSLTGESIFIHTCFELADSLWVILAWCMYHRIKSADAQMNDVEEISTTQSPPESPGASQSA